MTQEELLPCPFCGAGETRFHENHFDPTPSGREREPISVEVRHWCEPMAGVVRTHIVQVGRDRESAIAAWNRRTR